MVSFYLVRVSNTQDKPTTEITPVYNPSLQEELIGFWVLFCFVLFFHFKGSLAKKKLEYAENLTKHYKASLN